MRPLGLSMRRSSIHIRLFRRRALARVCGSCRSRPARNSIIGGRRPMKPAIDKPIMNLDDAVFDDVEENGIYTSSRALFSGRIGARKLGYNLTVLPPGKVQCPFHVHHAEE